MGAGAAAAGLAAFQLWSGLQQARLIARNAELTNEIAAANARFTEMDAYEAEKFGYTQSARYEGVVNATLGSQKAAMAAQNIDVNSATAKELQAESKLNGFLNVLDIQSQARRKALGLKFEAGNIRLGMQMTSAQSKIDQFGARVGGIANAAQTGISAYSRTGKLNPASTGVKKLSDTPSYDSNGNPYYEFESELFGRIGS